MDTPRARTRSKQIAVRFTAEEARTIRDLAFGQGDDMGPFVAQLVRALLPTLPKSKVQMAAFLAKLTEWAQSLPEPIEAQD
jgi:hypothetical protein